MGPPNAMLDYHSASDEMSASYTSNATALPILGTLSHFFILLIVIHHLGNILEVDQTTILNFIRIVYHDTIAFVNYLHHIFTARNARNLPTLILNVHIRLLSSALAGLRATPDFVQTARTLLPWLTRNLTATLPQGASITVSSLVLSGRGTVVVINNLPDDVSAPEVRRFLEVALWAQYHQEDGVESEDDDTHSEVDSLDSQGELEVHTSRHGLWRRTCVLCHAELVSMPGSADSSPTSSASGAGTPASSTSGDDSPASDSGSGFDSDSGSGSGSGPDVDIDAAAEAVVNATLAVSESLDLPGLDSVPPQRRLSTSRRA